MSGIQRSYVSLPSYQVDELRRRARIADSAEKKARGRKGSPGTGAPKRGSGKAIESPKRKRISSVNSIGSHGQEARSISNIRCVRR